MSDTDEAKESENTTEEKEEEPEEDLNENAKTPEGDKSVGKKSRSSSGKSTSSKPKSPKPRSSKSGKKITDSKNGSKPCSAAGSTTGEVMTPVNVGGYPKLDENGELPPGVFPHFMTSKTQEIFKCRMDEDLTEENPYRLIPKAEIMEDFRLRAGISDFHPFKQQIIDYQSDEILVGLDNEFAFGQNFFIVLSDEAKDSILNPPAPPSDEEAEEEEEVIYKWVPPESKPWVSLGSETEVMDENVYEHRKRVSVSIRRLRKDFGAPIQLEDRVFKKGKDSYVECIPDAEGGPQVTALQLNKATQAIPGQIESGTQTTWKYPRNATTQYYPREFTEEQCKEVEETGDVSKFVDTVTQRFRLALQQNEIMDIFYNDWINLGTGHDTIGSKADNHLKEYQSFTDLQFSKSKTIACIEWHPTLKGVVAVAAVDKHYFDERVDHSSKLIMNPSLILFWSFTDPIHPQLLLEAPDDIYSFKFSPTNNNIVAGGCINGQVVLWDITEYVDKLKQPRGGNRNKKATVLPGFEDENALKIPISRYCAVSSIENSHKSAITDLWWIPYHMEINRMGVPTESKAYDCGQLMTCSTDHNVLVWDTRASKMAMEKSKMFKNPMGVPGTFRHLDLTWKPLLKITTFKTEAGGDHSPTKFSIEERHQEKPVVVPTEHPPGTTSEMSQLPQAYESSEKKKVLEGVNTHLYVGTEDGGLVYVDWMPQKDSDTGKIMTPKPEYYHSIHDGPVIALERSPFFKDIVLCVGGWTMSIWKDGVSTGPILQSAAATSRLTDAMWSPSRPGVFYIARNDGSVDVWDLLDRTHEPSLKQSVSSTVLTAIHPYAVTSKQHLLAVGDALGTLHILEIPWSLRQPTPGEYAGVSNYFEREMKRREFVMKRWDIREEEKRDIEVEAQKKAGIAPAISLTESEQEARELLEYEEYLKAELVFLRALGLREEEDIDIPTT